ncbi:putative synaptotagmin-like mitochondrial-lipid-binding domain-containing protein [Helianthus annuus]|nr:putative synaptotagmin-like mitochondrial-lipid-binding domain-containing protein [Helianthus annuus]
MLVMDPVVKPISELDPTSLQELIPEIPLWLKNPDYDRVDWLNKFVVNMWPYLDKVHCKKPEKSSTFLTFTILGRKLLTLFILQAICAAIRQTTEPIFADYIGHGHRPIEAITFETLSLGSLPPTFQGVKVCETDENQLVMEPAIKWAGNPNIVIAVKISYLRIKIQLVDLQVFVVPRVILKPLVSTFPCFSNVVVSLMEKPHVDFGLKVLGGDVMSIPGLCQLVQVRIF